MKTGRFGDLSQTQLRAFEGVRQINDANKVGAVDGQDASVSESRGRSRGGFLGTLWQAAGVAVVAVMLSVGAGLGGAEASNDATSPTAITGTQLGGASYATGAGLGTGQVQAQLRSPSADDLKHSLLSFRSTIESGHTPYMQPFFEPGVGATVTRSANAWNSPNPVNTQYTIETLPKDGYVHVSMPLWVSGHTPDMYDAALYPKYTGAPMPDDVLARKKANAQLYAHPSSPMQNVHWVWARHLGSNTPDEVLIPGLKAGGEYVRLVQLALKVKPGETVQVRWSPYPGADPNHPIVGPDDFVAGRTFDVIVPKNVKIGN